ncbi:Sec-independent protein translocase subunit TatA [Leifsonia sp. C5G2]|uniref:Sec-independent protein translocase subunit TatA n=1 Tax=Leifsonia sp. C5G2 TaxID=2735269 RepID=UPI001584C3A6|nr:Sec-independent protein translocase subunit TatA [Leifsonia sp. C5G2]NUU05437.1 Sec-independent protein translocase subunit TatA [Leifsonia sp. C5G2]
MFAGLTGWHLLIILAVILLLFGAPKLPALAKSIGQSMRIFKGEVDELKKDGKDGAADKPADGTTGTAQNTAAPAPAPVDPSTESNPKS